MPSGEAGHGTTCTWRYTPGLHLLGTSGNRTEPRSFFARLKGKCSLGYDTSADSLSVWKSPWGEKSDHRPLCSLSHMRLDRWEDTCIFSLNSLYILKRKKMEYTGPSGPEEPWWSERDQGNYQEELKPPLTCQYSMHTKGAEAHSPVHSSSTPVEPAGAWEISDFRLKCSYGSDSFHKHSFLFRIFHSFNPTLPWKSHGDFTCLYTAH